MAHKAKQKHVSTGRLPKPKVDWEEVLLCQARSIGLPEPQRQYKGIPGRRFAFDFLFTVHSTQDLGGLLYMHTHHLVVEVEGGTWSRASRHTSPAGYARDCEKYNLATKLGYEVYRFTSDRIKSGEAVNFLREVVIEREHGVREYPVWAPESANVVFGPASD